MERRGFSEWRSAKICDHWFLGSRREAEKTRLGLVEDLNNIIGDCVTCSPEVGEYNAGGYP